MCTCRCVPLWARLPTNHIFSFVYICILSFMRGADEQTRDGGAAPFAVAPLGGQVGGGPQD